MNAFCTIINRKYIPYAKVLYRSIARFIPGIQFRVLVVDEETGSNSQTADSNLEFIFLQDVLRTPIAKEIFDKYAHTNQDHLRWAFKPILLLYLLDRFDKVIFTDPDVYFTGDPSFLFDELERNDVLLAPHWSETDPLKYEDGLFSVMRNGLYSGGFIGAGPGAKPVLQWWAKVCHYKMDESKELGVFVDQKYLDLFPLLHERTCVIRHPGCNLTNINLLTCRRSLVNGKLFINEAYDPIFIHFTRDTIYNIEKGNDPLLKDHLQRYRDELNEAGYAVTAPAPEKFYEPVKRKFLLKTRLKKFFFRLAEKI